MRSPTVLAHKRWSVCGNSGFRRCEARREESLSATISFSGRFCSLQVFLLGSFRNIPEHTS
jgi:hypothetical protein